VPKTVILGAKDKLCVNEQFKQEAAGQSGQQFRLGCKNLLDANGCPYKLKN